MKSIPVTIRIAVCNMLFIVLFTSCTHYYYGPNSGNIPLLKNKGDVRIAAAVASSDETSGYELQSAYAFVKHFAGMFNFYYADGGESTTSSQTTATETGNGVYAELGAGYFSPINKSNWIFEAYGGAGTGTVNNTYGLNEASKVGVFKIFMQPSVGYTTSNGVFNVAVASRFSHVHLRIKELNLSGNNPGEVENIYNIKNEPNIVYWEPSIVFRLGFNETIKLQLQATSSTALKSKYYSSQSEVYALGLIFSFNTGSTKDR